MFRLTTTYGGFTITAKQERISASIRGLIYGEIQGLPTAGWSHEKARQIFGAMPKTLPAEWPPKARGLPLPERKRLPQIGLHGLESQLTMLRANTTLTNEGLASTVYSAFIQGLEARAMRGIDRRMLTLAHHHRRGGDTQIREAPTGIGPICLGLSDACLAEDESSELIVRLVSQSHDFYQDPLTAGLSTWFALIVRAAANAEMGQSVDLSIIAEWIAAVDEVTPAQTQCFAALANVFTHGMATEHGWSEGVNALGELPGPLERGRSVIATILFSSQMAGAPQAALETVLTWMGETGRTGAVAGGILGARFQSAFPELENIVDGARVHRYAEAIGAGQVPVESVEEFLSKEAELSHQEYVFRDQMAAERRTRGR